MDKNSFPRFSPIIYLFIYGTTTHTDRFLLVGKQFYVPVETFLVFIVIVTVFGRIILVIRICRLFKVITSYTIRVISLYTPIVVELHFMFQY